MKRLPEQRLWDRFRKHCGPYLRLERIENMVGDGTPDVLVQAGHTTFVELKARPKPPVRASSLALGQSWGPRRTQVAWHLDWQHWGGRSAFLVEVGREIFLLDGLCAPYLKDYEMSDLATTALARTWDDIIFKLQSDCWTK